jgi:hypothetical protein
MSGMLCSSCHFILGEEVEACGEGPPWLCLEHWAHFRERERRGELHSLKMLAASNSQTEEEKYLAYAQRLALGLAGGLG